MHLWGWFAQVHMYAHEQTHTHTQMHSHTNRCTHAHTLAHTHTHARTNTHTHTHARTHAHALAHTYTHAIKHTYTHTHTHTHIHTHTHKSSLPSCLGSVCPQSLSSWPAGSGECLAQSRGWHTTWMPVLPVLLISAQAEGRLRSGCTHRQTANAQSPCWHILHWLELSWKKVKIVF